MCLLLVGMIAKNALDSSKESMFKLQILIPKGKKGKNELIIAKFLDNLTENRNEHRILEPRLEFLALQKYGIWSNSNWLLKYYWVNYHGSWFIWATILVQGKRDISGNGLPYGSVLRWTMLSHGKRQGVSWRLKQLMLAYKRVSQ